MPRFVARLPRGCYPSPAWRAALREINRRLADPSTPLAQGFAEAEQLAQDHGEIAASERIDRLLHEHLDLFPGEAGRRLAWSTLCGEAPSVSAIGEDWQPVNVFQLDQPSPLSRRGRPERDEQDDKIRRLLDYIAEPLTFTEIAARFKMTGTELHRWLDRLKKQQGLEFPRSHIQRFYVGFARVRVPKPEPEPDVDCPFCDAALGGSDLPCWRCRKPGAERAARWQEINAEQLERERRDERERKRVASLNAPEKRGCLFCDWTFQGTADEGSRAFAEHRRTNHH